MFLDINRWYNEYGFQWYSGPQYSSTGIKEGQVLKVIPMLESIQSETDVYYFQDFNKVIPEKIIVSRLWLSATKDWDWVAVNVDSDAGLESMLSFYIWSFEEVDGKTNVTISGIADWTLSSDVEVTLEQGKEGKKNWIRSWTENIARLDELLSSKSRG